MTDEKSIQIGSDDTVIIEKVFGPLIFANLRITAEARSGDWIIEREWIREGEYVPWVRIPGQIAQEFSEEQG